MESLIEDKNSRSNKGHNSEKKKIYILNCLLDSMHCALDSEDILSSFNSITSVIT